jgi:hypothetical protein
VHCKSDIHSNQLSNFLRKSKFIPKIEKSDPLDCVHTVESAKLHQMEVQDTVIFPVDPGLHWNHTKLIADKGQEYSISAKGEWYDMGIPSSATGYGKSHLTQKWFEKDRRVKDSKWMALEIVVGNELKSPTTYTHDGQLVEVSKKGEISMFANDVCGFYWNNFGKMSVSITRTK